MRDNAILSVPTVSAEELSTAADAPSPVFGLPALQAKASAASANGAPPITKRPFERSEGDADTTNVQPPPSKRARNSFQQSHQPLQQQRQSSQQQQHQQQQQQQQQQGSSKGDDSFSFPVLPAAAGAAAPLPMAFPAEVSSSLCHPCITCVKLEECSFLQKHPA